MKTIVSLVYFGETHLTKCLKICHWLRCHARQVPLMLLRDALLSARKVPNSDWTLLWLLN